MIRFFCLMLVLLLPGIALTETWVRVPASMLQEGWLTAQTSDEEAVLAAVVDTPRGFAPLSDLRFLAVDNDTLAEVQFSASFASRATPTDLMDAITFSAAGRRLTCRRDEQGMTASFTSGDLCFSVHMAPKDTQLSDRTMLNRLPQLVACIHPVGEVSGMPLPDIAWGMDEDALISRLGVAIYAVPLSGEGWEGLEYVTPLYGAQVAELDCCMLNGRLSMMLAGLQESSTDRVKSLLSDTLGDPRPAVPGELSAAMKLITGSDMRFPDALMWRCADANVYLARWNNVVMVLFTDPTQT